MSTINRMIGLNGWIKQNARYHEAIQNTPFFLMHGFHPWTGLEGVKISERSPGAKEWKEQWENARKAAVSALEKVAESMKRFYDRKQASSHDYKEGQMVWLDGRNIKTLRPSKKLDQKKLGPFKIVEMIGRRSY